MTLGERLAAHGLALPPGHVLVSLEERPELRHPVGELNAAAWPEFMLHDPVVDANWHHLYEDFGPTQACLFDPAGELVAGLNSAPLAWDGTDEGLPGGWDDQFLRTVAGLAPGAPPPDTLGALQVVVRRDRRGSGYSGLMVEAMRAIARSRGYRAVIACVRPTEKDRYQLTPIGSYATWTRADGLPLDPWIRLHARLGARIVRGVPRSMTISRHRRGVARVDRPRDAGERAVPARRCGVPGHDRRRGRRGRLPRPQRVDGARPPAEGRASGGRGRLERAVEDAAVDHVDGPTRADREVVVVGDHDDRLARPATSDSNSSNTSSAVAESRLPVGSSATMIGGSLASARAIADALLLAAGRATPGSLRAWSAMPTCSSRCHRPLQALARASTGPQKSIGSITFSTTVSVGSSWKNWKMTPTVRPRHCAIRLSVSVSRGPCRRPRPRPTVGRSMPVIMFISVDLPQPDLPTIATNSPRVDLEARPA